MGDLKLTRAEVLSWLEEFHAFSARLDTSAWMSTYFSSAVTMQYANLPTIHGYEAVHTFFENILPKLSKMEHKIRDVEYVEPVIYQSAEIRYEIKGDERKEGEREISIVGFMVAELVKEDGSIKAKRLETYLDPGEVMGRIQEVYGG